MVNNNVKIMWNLYPIKNNFFEIIAALEITTIYYAYEGMIEELRYSGSMHNFSERAKS